MVFGLRVVSGFTAKGVASPDILTTRTRGGLVPLGLSSLQRSISCGLQKITSLRKVTPTAGRTTANTAQTLEIKLQFGEKWKVPSSYCVPVGD